MKVLCILLCVAFASGFYIDNNGIHEEKIIGGYRVRIENLPYQASLLWHRTDNICGATIIHHSWIITAAHCVQNMSHISIRTGSGFRKIGGQIYTVAKIIIHEDFGTNGKNDDIALIKLAQPIQFNYEQRPIELAKPHDILREHEFMRISGFGKTGLHRRRSNFLMAAYVPVVNQENCERAYRTLDPINNNMFCAGNGDADIYYGDSGRPGVIHDKLYGIISSGEDCGSRIMPGVYTRVHKFYDWIVEKTGHIFYKSNLV